MATDVKELLETVITLIEKDVAEIRVLSLQGKLPHPVSQDLVDYSRALLNLGASIEAKDKEAKAKLSKMTTEELTQLAKNIIEGKKL